MTKATSQRGMTYNYAYNARGLATSLEAKNSAGTMSLKSDVEYSANGRFVTKTYDQDGRSDTYNYNTTTGFLDSVTDDDTNTTINYSYNTNNGNLLSASQTANSENITVSNNYSYSSAGNLLTKINRNDTSYNIEYDKFNNTTVNKVGSQVLTSFDYGANNGILQKVTYGTGQYINYSYDNYGNIQTIGYNGKTAFKWYSDKSGAIIRGNDLINNREFFYDYDTTGRLVRQSTIDTSLSATKIASFQALNMLTI